jgi:hypothetical protein
MHSTAQFFFLWRKGGEGLFSQCVPIKFLLGFQYVPNSTLLYLISFAFSFDLVTKITRAKQGHYSIRAFGHVPFAPVFVFL